MASAPVISAAGMMAGMLREESRASGGPMQTLSSARRTCMASVSAVECTATVAMPSSRQARNTRNAISPRLAMRIFLNIMLRLLDDEERLVELHGGAGGDQNLLHGAGARRL